MIIPSKRVHRDAQNVSIRLSAEALQALDVESAFHRTKPRTLLRDIIGAWLAQRGHKCKEAGASSTVGPVEEGHDNDPD